MKPCKNCVKFKKQYNHVYQMLMDRNCQINSAGVAMLGIKEKLQEVLYIIKPYENNLGYGIGKIARKEK